MLKKSIIAFCLLAVLPGLANARTILKNFCRVKGQEENVLRGVGLVVGLNGTGEVNDGPTMRARDHGQPGRTAGCTPVGAR